MKQGLFLFFPKSVRLMDQAINLWGSSSKLALKLKLLQQTSSQVFDY